MDSFKKKNYKSKLIDVVIFHYPCQDGLSSAWVAHHYLKTLDKEHELFPVQNNTSYTEEYLDNLYEKVKDKYVAIFDFSFNISDNSILKLYVPGATVKRTTS